MYLTSGHNTLQVNGRDMDTDSDGYIYSVGHNSWTTSGEIILSDQTTYLTGGGFYITKQNTSGDFMFITGFGGTHTNSTRPVDLEIDDNDIMHVA